MQPGRVRCVMPPYGGVPLSDERVAAVASYILSLDRKQQDGRREFSRARTCLEVPL
jgi:hypothetical protein